MSIRARILSFLLPSLIVFVILISLFFYFNWYQEIISSFRSHLKSVITSEALALDESTPIDQKRFNKIKQKLPLTNIHTISFRSDLPAHELQVFETKEPFITKIYRKDRKRFLTGYAPITNKEGEVVSLFAADLNVDPIESKLQSALTIVLLSASFIIALIITCVFITANRISRPVKKLKNAALAIASGKYGDQVSVEGPQEIRELANTLNVMSECLDEQINRFKETSAAKERMHGEQECAKLLQHQMLQRVIEEHHSPLFSLHMHQVGFPAARLQIFDDQLILSEAPNNDFLDLYNLLSKNLHSGQINLSLKPAVSFQVETMATPLVWSPSKGKMAEDGSWVFLYNSDFSNCFINKKEIPAWFENVFKHFTEDEFDLAFSLLGNKLNFLTKKHHQDCDALILIVKEQRVPPAKQ